MNYFNEVTAAAFEDELEKIAQDPMVKQAGLGNFLIKGIKGWQGSFGRAANAAKGLKGGRTWGQQWNTAKKVYQRGARQGGGVWGGVKGLAKSPYGAMAGTAGIGGLAAYGGYKATLGRDSSHPQQRY